jgi:hypothetical protein
MRKDMKDMIINTGRVGGGGKAAMSRRARLKRMDDEDVPSFIPSSRHRQFGWDGKEVTDRLAPLTGFLEANIGRQWDDVYSEICEYADSRTIRGYHLRMHVWQEVVPNNYDVGHRRRYGPFFVDTDGTLQHEKPYVRQRRKKDEKPFLSVDKDHYYMKIEGYWYYFETTHIAHENSFEELVEKENGDVEIVRIPLKDWWEHVTTKRQVTGEVQKELDRLWVEQTGGAR